MGNGPVLGARAAAGKANGEYTMIESRLEIKLRRDTKARSLSYFFTTDVADVDRGMIDDLVRASRAAGNKNARICLHTSPQATFHDMIILEYSGGYYRPHKHAIKGETCHIIEGRVLFVVFDETGRVTHRTIVGNAHHIVFRVGIGQWHTVIPLSEYAIYHEAKLGPFIPESDSLYPDWAPDGTDLVEAERYLRSLIVEGSAR